MNINSYEIYLNKIEKLHKKESKKMMKSIIENKKKEAPFQLFFLKNKKNQNIEAIEVNEIDCKEVINRLEKSESVFITQKQEQKPNMHFTPYELAREPWYFIHS